MATGGNQTASNYSGVNSKKVIMMTFVISAVTVALGSVLMAARNAQADSTMGQGLEFDVIAGVILGGASLDGGAGSVYKSFVGIMILTTESGVRIDVESFVCNGQCYDIKCEVVCENGIINLPKPATIEVLANTIRGNAVDATWATRFTEAYDREFQKWIDASSAGRVDGPSAWDGYCCQVCAAAASKAREEQTIVPVKYDPMPDFYYNN